MFGGQDDNALAPPTGGGSKDDTLTGVDDLAASLNAATGKPAPDTDGGMMPSPSEPPRNDNPAPAEETDGSAAPAPAGSAPAPATDNDGLLDIKQQALQQLTPIVSHLDQSPEERFRTFMMLIQASDNQDLLKEAYEAANAIGDEKLKAQALLDVVNEINYFTQAKPDSPAE